MNTALAVARGRLFGQVAEAAAILEVDPRTVRHGIEAGTIPAVRVSDSTIRIPWVAFLRDVCGLDDNALAALDLPGFISAERTEGDPATGSPTATTTALTEGDPHSHVDSPEHSASSNVRPLRST